MSSAAAMHAPKDVMLSTRSMVIRFAAIAITSSLVYWFAASSELKANTSFWWAWTGHAGTPSAAISQSLAILAIVLGVTLVVALTRIKRGKAHPAITTFDRHVIRFAVYEEFCRWFLWLLWLTVASDVEWLHWLLTPLVGVGGIATFGILGNHVGDHSVVFAGAAILASVRITRGPESTQWWSRLTGTYIGLLTFSVVFNFGIIYAVVFRVVLYLLSFKLKRFLERFEH